ncbi:hypothetical protein [Nitrospirillum iridis]|uniref:Uncharacterized protein n=1 Tax=Nitrospirillum iridis TaxID=765888 RepID=A0A7X0AWY9_9PROT|nr:hypothetical protein [Nitrospirillum iridis]MBB6251643.1 hypothetical protein [Nitrospirillum iridis]
MIDPWHLKARGDSQASATPVRVSIAFVVKVSLTASGGTGGVRLVSTAPGRRRVLLNQASSSARVYPGFGRRIRTLVTASGSRQRVSILPTNAPTTLGLSEFIEFLALPDGTWLTLVKP